MCSPRQRREAERTPSCTHHRQSGVWSTLGSAACPGSPNEQSQNPSPWSECGPCEMLLGGKPRDPESLWDCMAHQGPSCTLHRALCLDLVHSGVKVVGAHPIHALLGCLLMAPLVPGTQTVTKTAAIVAGPFLPPGSWCHLLLV